MEQEGIFYFFEHSFDQGGNGAGSGNLKDLMVLVDANDSCLGDSTLKYVPEAGQGKAGEDHIFTWHETSAMRPTRYALRDYHFEKAEATLEISKKGTHKFGTKDWEIYDYPGEYAQRFDKPDSDQGDGQEEADITAQLRIEEKRAALRWRFLTAARLQSEPSCELQSAPHEHQPRGGSSPPFDGMRLSFHDAEVGRFAGASPKPVIRDCRTRGRAQGPRSRSTA